MSEKFKISAVAVACALALSACGSGGGSSSPSTAPTNTNNGGSTPSANNNTNTGSNTGNTQTPENNAGNTATPAGDNGYSAAKSAYDQAWNNGAAKNELDAKKYSMAQNSRLVDVAKEDYDTAAAKANSNVYNSEADKKAAEDAANEYKNTADARVTAVNDAFVAATAAKATAEKALAEAEKMLAAKPDDETAKADKAQAEELLIEADNTLVRFNQNTVDEAQQADAAAAEAVKTAQAATVKAPEPTPAQPEEPAKPQPEPAAKGFGGDAKEMTKAIDGGVLVAKKRETGTLEYTTAEAPSATSKDTVVLDGAEVKTAKVEKDKFSRENTLKDGANGESAYMSIHSGNLLTDVRYGGAVDLTNIQDIKQALFVQGTPSEKDTVAAKTGTVVYKGTGLHFKTGLPFNTSGLFSGFVDTSNGTAKVNNTYTNARTTDVTATVDFGKKNIKVNIDKFPENNQRRVADVIKANDSELPDNLTFNGKISGNTFADDKGNLQGGFYGSAADQLAGAYKDAASDARGVFGAKVDKNAVAKPDTGSTTQPAKPDTGSTTPAKPEETSKPAASAGLTKGALGENNFIADVDNIAKLVIGSTTIALDQAKKAVEIGYETAVNWFTNDAPNVVTSNQTHSAYGAAKLNDGSYTLFVQGTPTAAMPEGTAKYTGNVLNYRFSMLDGKWVEAVSNGGVKAGSFDATADFGQKTITGNIDSNDRWYMNKQAFSGSISGNKFNAAWTSGATGSVNGGFYGDNAAEIAGKYEYIKEAGSSDNAFGVFGGKKQ